MWLAAAALCGIMHLLANVPIKHDEHATRNLQELPRRAGVMLLLTSSPQAFHQCCPLARICFNLEPSCCSNPFQTAAPPTSSRSSAASAACAALPSCVALLLVLLAQVGAPQLPAGIAIQCGKAVPLAAVQAGNCLEGDGSCVATVGRRDGYKQPVHVTSAMQ